MSQNGVVKPPVSNSPPMVSESPQKKGLVKLKPGESVRVIGGSVETPRFGVYKLWGVFVQDPETLIEGYRKKLGKMVEGFRVCELISDTLTYSYLPSCNPLEKEPDYKDLTVIRKLNSSTTAEDYRYYGFYNYTSSFSTDFTHLVRLEITSKDNMEEITASVRDMKNLRDLKLTLASGDIIPSFVKDLSGLISLSITVMDNQQKKVPLKGLDELAALSALQHLELRNTFIAECPKWIKKSPSLCSLTLLNAFIAHPVLSGISKLEQLSVNVLDVSAGNSPAVLADLGNLTGLKELSLINYESGLPANLPVKLKQLEKLTVRAARVEFVPALAGWTSLKELNISLPDKPMGAYPEGMETLVHLKKMELTGCFNNIEFPELSGCKKLEFVRITDRSMNRVPANMEALRSRVADFKLIAPYLIKPSE